MSEMLDVHFACPDCGGKSFKFISQPHTLDNVDGTTCATCGRFITKDDVVAFSLNKSKVRAQDIIRDAFKNWKIR